MNLKQRIALLAGIAIVIAIGMFLPWTYVYQFPGSGDIKPLTVERPAGYHSIFRPPLIPDDKTISTLFGFDEWRVREDNDAYSYQQFLEDTGRAKAKPRPYARYYFQAHVDTSRLALESAVAVFFIGGLLFVLRTRRNP
jgi:hypothetical protein